MQFRKYILGLSKEELAKYAESVGTTTGYLKTHLLYGYKEPRKKLRKALAYYSQGKVSEAEVLEHFGIYSTKTVINQNGNTPSI
ncbi:hypothetical protein E0H86_05985 [Acinetobacter sp. ANC 4635]|uniref:hypothetical protein n=1 Tax=Acinetobacter sp. ANC 4635 TaxID=2529846 RepID=UPI00103D2BE9|nr:hypothetical protein [Acinetobacter sp. ANC 4635]TCB31967.1 hypothetical protein E0H86_05985 [Acinetobacter sp. ANC 4635]